MSKPKRRARAQTFTNLRTAVLRRWKDGDTPGKIAMRLDQPTQYVHVAIAADVKRVIGAYGSRSTADTLAADLELPRAFVVYVIRRINAVAADRRRRRNTEEKPHVPQDVDGPHARRRARAQSQQQGRRQQGAGRSGCRPEQSPVSSGAVP